MNKTQLLTHILMELKSLHQCAVDAAQRAYETATAEENEAENKYDTLGLEASYLAHGQSKRVAECEADAIAFEKIPHINFTDDNSITIGAMVLLLDAEKNEKCVFLSPVAGGLKVQFENKEITLVTLSAPLGKALNNCYVGDELNVKIGQDIQQYQITDVF